jgi:hypothetical protein
MKFATTLSAADRKAVISTDVDRASGRLDALERGTGEGTGQVPVHEHRFAVRGEALDLDVSVRHRGEQPGEVVLHRLSAFEATDDSQSWTIPSAANSCTSASALRSLSRSKMLFTSAVGVTVSTELMLKPPVIG